MQVKPRYKGILLIVCSAFCFAFMNAFVRLSGDLPSVQKSFFRNFVALIVAVVMFAREGAKPNVPKDAYVPLFLRAAFGTVGILCNYYAIDHLVLSDASMLNKMS
ncbi:MAG: EamA family transporter, partial [Oscillospiraceae bacterium]|nr:EamA family transporter [Oscillospiraceae bacterium]